MSGKREVKHSTAAAKTEAAKITKANSSSPADKKGKRSKNGKRLTKTGSWKKRLLMAAVALFTLVGIYITLVFSSIPFIAKWRTIYIETAMSTMTHQWLATLFIPQSVIDDVMAKVQDDLNSQIGLESSWDDVDSSSTGRTTTTIDEDGNVITEFVYETDEEAEFFETYWELDSESVHSYFDENAELLEDGYDSLFIDNSSGDLELETVNGDEIYVIDTENNLIILTVKGSNYQGKLAIIKNAEQVDLVKSANLGSYGQIISTLAENNNAVLAMNCSGFGDTDGHGTGGYVMGSLVLDGVDYGHPQSGTWKLFGFNYSNQLCIMDYSSSAVSSFRWAAQFYPALVINGSSVVDGTFGMGLQPRACFGQTISGDVLMLVIDGRQVGHSIGCTVADCTEILLSYEAYQAMNLDGGSSAIMYYKGELITSPSSVSSLGRYLPDALIVTYAS